MGPSPSDIFSELAAGAWSFAVIVAVLASLVALSLEAILQIGGRLVLHRLFMFAIESSIAEARPDVIKSVLSKPKSRVWRLPSYLQGIGLRSTVYALPPPQLFAQIAATMQAASEADFIRPDAIILASYGGFGRSDDLSDAIALSNPETAAGVSEERSERVRLHLAIASERAVDRMQYVFSVVWVAARLILMMILSYSFAVIALDGFDYRFSDSHASAIAVPVALATSVTASALHDFLVNMRRR